MKSPAVWDMVKSTYQDFMDDESFRLAAAMSYYALLAMAPLLMVVLAVTGWVWRRDAVAERVVGEFSGMVSEQGAEVVQTILQEASMPSKSILAAVLGIITLLIGATGLFAQLQSALNTVWGVKVRPKQGLQGLFRKRLLSLALLLVVAFLLLVSLVISAGLTAAGDYLSVAVSRGSWFWSALNIAGSFVVISLLFAMIFKYLPDVVILWRDVWKGAVFTALLFTVGKYLISLYLGHSSVGSAYGAAGSVVVIVVWVYYSSIILFLGAEFTQVHAYNHGSSIIPKKYAMWRDERVESFK